MVRLGFQYWDIGRGGRGMDGGEGVKRENTRVCWGEGGGGGDVSTQAVHIDPYKIKWLQLYWYGIRSMRQLQVHWSTFTQF